MPRKRTRRPQSSEMQLPTKKQKLNSQTSSTTSHNQKNKRILIKNLHPWVSPNWSVQAEVIFKSVLHTIIVKGSERDHFWIILQDSSNKSIKMSFWGDACLRFETLSQGKAYKIQHAGIKNVRDLRYAVYNKYELVCGPNTSITELVEDEEFDDVIAEFWKPLDNIKQIEEHELNEVFDIIGFVDQPSNENVTQKPDGTIITKRTFELVDSTGKIGVTAWNYHAKLKVNVGDLVAISRAKLTDWNQRTLVVLGFIQIKPNITKATRLQKNKKHVFNRLKKIKDLSGDGQSPINWELAEEIEITKILNLQNNFRQNGILPENMSFIVSASISNLDNKLWFEKNGEKKWRLRLTLQDENHNWFRAVAFDAVGMKIFKGMSATEAAELQSEEDEQFHELIEQLLSENEILRFGCCFRENKYFAQHQLDCIIHKLFE